MTTALISTPARVPGTVEGLVRRPVVFSSETVEWATPQDFFDRCAAEFGPFDLDVCATPENAKCARFFTRADDGLAQPWAPARCWMNPPYGREMGVWVRKAHDEAQRGALVVCLVPARTDVAWWHDWGMKAEIRLLRGRLRFQRADGALLSNNCPSVREGRHAPTTTAPFATALLVFRPPNAGAVPRRGSDVGTSPLLAVSGSGDK